MLGKLVRKEIQDDEKLVLGVIRLVRALTVGLFSALTNTNNLIIGAFILGIGLWLILLRDEFMLMLPLIILVEKPVVISYNIFSQVAKFIINLIIDGIDDFEHGIDDVLDFFDIDLHLPELSHINPGQIDDTKLHDKLTYIASNCGPFNNIKIIMQWISYYFCNDWMCPLVRITYPLKKTLHDPLNSMFGGTFYKGDANMLLYTPDPLDNCKWKVDDSDQGICIALGTGYIIAEVLFSAFVIGVILYVILGPLTSLIWDFMLQIWLRLREFFAITNRLEKLFDQLL